MARPPRNFNSGRFSNHTVRANHFIRAREVFVIDGDGKPVGNMPTPAALDLAKRSGLDLVEISPNANPPVCKILDYGKYRYEIAKKDKDSKKHGGASKVKEMQFHLNIDPHDYATKLRHAEQFMWKGMKVKLSLFLRGRENLHKDLGEALMRRVRADLSHIGAADQEPKFVGKSISMMLTPFPLQKRTRKFTEADEAEEPEGEEEETTESSADGQPESAA
ncbi:MAG: translation initiation factor IF-3 [Verrucomicrobium sp.]|nr:translation initiation factor IF-3 [Verrucomicrobium sp.]